jgi:hypothetical protein
VAREAQVSGGAQVAWSPLSGGGRLAQKLTFVPVRGTATVPNADHPMRARPRTRAGGRYACVNDVVLTPAPADEGYLYVYG